MGLINIMMIAGIITELMLLRHFDHLVDELADENARLRMRKENSSAAM